MEEPSVLDYLKSLLDPRRPRIEIPGGGEDPQEGGAATLESGEDGSPVPIEMMEPAHEAVESREEEWRAAPEVESPAQPESESEPAPWVLPWRSLLALFLALMGQNAFEPPGRRLSFGIALYLLAAGLLAWAAIRDEWRLAPFPQLRRRNGPFAARANYLMISVPLAAIAFFAFGGNRFNRFNLAIWLLALAFVVAGFWLPDPGGRPWWRRVKTFLARPRLEIKFNSWTLFLLGMIALATFFRFYRLDAVPPEMISDHAEKLIDVRDVLNGEYSIFFPRNTGREAFQFYLTAAVDILFGTGISFMSLKLGTAIAGMVTLLFMYLLGVEIGNRRVGLLALVFTGIAYWPNVISRIALRFALYPLFVAPTLYFLIRGLRRENRNDFILAGLFLGVGLHGYSSFRVVPFLVVIAVGLYLLGNRAALGRQELFLGIAGMSIVSVLVFLPLLRFITEKPEHWVIFTYRFTTRISGAERPLPGPAGEIFLRNLWNGVTMFAWDNGETWVHSVVHRPALDVVSAALFYMGVVLLLMRFIRQRKWIDILLIVSVPILLMPSVLSLAFPAENPSLNRPSGVIVPVFLIVAMALDGFMTGVQSRLGPRGGARIAWGVTAVLVFWSALQNYDLVFKQYFVQYQRSSWNTTELGEVVRGYVDSIGETEGVWVVGYPHWVDTRLVSIIAGFPEMDHGVVPEQMIERSQQYTGSKLFLLHPQAADSIEMLENVYPGGMLQLYPSKVETKDFWMYFVPYNARFPQQGGDSESDSDRNPAPQNDVVAPTPYP